MNRRRFFSVAGLASLLPWVKRDEAEPEVMTLQGVPLEYEPSLKFSAAPYSGTPGGFFGVALTDAKKGDIVEVVITGPAAAEKLHSSDYSNYWIATDEDGTPRDPWFRGPGQ